METGFYKDLSNGIRVCVDWLSFTFTDTCDPYEVIDFLGIPYPEFASMPRGLNGYLRQLKHSSFIIVLYDGRNDMGVHVIVPGSAVHKLIEYYSESCLVDTPFNQRGFDVEDFDTTILREFLTQVVKHGNVTRLDLAIDDIGTQYYDIKSVINQLESGAYSSKFKGYRILQEIKNGCTGTTVYLGSGKSDCMVRIYDKQAEQNAKLSRAGEPLIEHTWLRWELELKFKNAHNTAVAIAHGKSISDSAVGLLSNYIRFVYLDDSNISRCTTDDTWLLFCNGISKFSVYVLTPQRTIDDIKRWLNRQVSPSLAKVVLSEFGDMEFIYNMVNHGAQRLSAHDVNMLSILEDGISKYPTIRETVV